MDASSRSPLEINKREMLYTLMTFPQWLSKTKAAIKLLCRGWDCPQPDRGREILSPLYTMYQRPTGGNGAIIRSLCGMGPTGDSLGNAPHPNTDLLHPDAIVSFNLKAREKCLPSGKPGKSRSQLRMLKFVGPENVKMTRAAKGRFQNNLTIVFS